MFARMEFAACVLGRAETRRKRRNRRRNMEFQRKQRVKHEKRRSGNHRDLRCHWDQKLWQLILSKCYSALEKIELRLSEVVT